MGGFRSIFADLEDPRTGNAQRHDLHEILVIALCTVLCGGEDCSDMALFGRAKEPFLRQFLRLEHGIPSHDTFSRVFRLLDPARFHACFLAFMRAFAEGCRGVVALDGKTLRRSFDRAAGQSPLHLVSAWAVEQRLVLGQVAVDAKSNEITAVPQLLRMLSLDGVVVTADAMACQRAIAAQISDQGGAYVLALKANQGTLFEDVKLFLDDPAVALAKAETTDGEHGRIEVRQVALSPDIAWLQERHAWPGLQAIGKVSASRETKGQTSRETRYFLLSRVFSPERFGEIVRAHWGIENGLHWVLDVTMNEDQLRNRKDHGPENLALLRRLALNLAKLEPSKGSMKGKLKRAGWTMLTSPPSSPRPLKSKRDSPARGRPCP
jgi:predicted transposase YbfD/YdcC